MSSSSYLVDRDERAAVHWTIALSGLIALLTMFHWTHVAIERYSLAKKNNTKGSLFSTAQSIRAILLINIPGFTNLLNLTLSLIYMAVNIIFAFTGVPWASPTVLNNFARRMGWLTALNIALVTLLSLRHTPLTILTGASYEKLRHLHKIVGYTIACLVVLHAVPIVVYLHDSGMLFEHFQGNHNRSGIVAGISILLTVFTATIIRRWHYELFYIIHAVLFALIIIMIGLHRPIPSTESFWIPIFAGIIWSYDRIWKTLGLLINSVNNDATLTPLPNGSVRVTLKKARMSQSPIAGRHAYLWIPAIRLFETHPFTVSNSNPLEFVIEAREGFTKDLKKHAVENPGTTVWASSGGLYGKTPDFSRYDRVILIAGGSGASFSFGSASEIISGPEKTTIDFIWIIRNRESLPWFKSQLGNLKCQPSVNVRIYITSDASADPSLYEGKKTEPPTPSPTVRSNCLRQTDGALYASSTGESSFEIQSGRPEVPALLQRIVVEANEAQSFAIAACGPDNLTKDVRSAARQMMRKEKRHIEYYEERFGW